MDMELEEWGCVADIEFTVLLLRICCFASQSLLSPSYMVDSVRGVPLI